MPESDYTAIAYYILEEIKKARSVPAGRQHADDPDLLRDVMLRTLQRFNSASLTEQQKKNLYTTFVGEAQQYSGQWNRYVNLSDYKDYFSEIEKLINRIKP